VAFAGEDHLTKPSLLLADDDAAFLDGLRQLLEPEFRILDCVGDGRALITAARALAPDVILTDISMPYLSGIQAARQIKAIRPSARVIVLTVHEERAFAVQAERCGVLAYVLKRRAAWDLIPAIRAVIDGSPFICPASLEE
jgi:DNA-binding NarL/FixJ family response regulator